MSKTIAIPVGKTNFNRYKFGTHTLQQVLELEGVHIDKYSREHPTVTDSDSGDSVLISRVELRQKSAPVTRKRVTIKPVEIVSNGS